MLSSLSMRSPLILRVFLTAVSALSAIMFASAFTRVPPSAAGSSLAASPVSWSSNAYTTGISRDSSAWHLWHLRHLEHLAHLQWLATVAEQQREQEVAREAAARPAPVTVTYHATPAPRSQAVATAVTYNGGSGVQACIIARESGGNSQVMNASGHYGLYQFSYSTWVGSGGSAADFGHASVAEQNQVFANAVAARGYSDWAPYDGCGA